MTSGATSKLRVGPRAIALLHHFESCRLRAYRCPAGVWTIGWGSTHYEDGRPVQPGDTISQARADALFRNVLTKFEDAVRGAVEGSPTAAHHFGAMVSFAYNVGVSAFQRSSVRRHHVAGKHAQAAESFLLWVKASGKVLPGLVRRRQAERLLYLGDLEAFDKAIGYRA